MKIKPCSFCGGEGVLMHTYTNSMPTSRLKGSRVRCKKCDVLGIESDISPKYSSDKKAIKNWNRRDKNETQKSN